MALALIEIIATPPGEAPEWVRTAWVGLRLIMYLPGSGAVSRGTLSGPPHPDNIGGYSVRTTEAIETLREVNPTAAAWWDDNIEPANMPWLTFGKQFCEVMAD